MKSINVDLIDFFRKEIILDFGCFIFHYFGQHNNVIHFRGPKVLRGRRGSRVLKAKR